MFGLAYRTFTQERVYHDNSLTRSTQSTSREIELYVSGLRRALRIFATEENEMLTQAITFSKLIPDVEEKLKLHFPEQLAFALSITNAQSPLVNEPELFGDHCRANMNLYAQNEQDLETGLSLHISGPEGSEHFDVMALFPVANSLTGESGVIFVSFGVDDLERLLKSGSSSAYTLSLENSVKNEELGNILLSPNVASAPSEPILSAISDYSHPVKNTPWMLNGFKNTNETTRVWNASLLQTIIGALVLLFAGLTAWRSIEQEKISRNRTAIVLNSVESERRRIARDLHDQVLSDVTHAKRLLMELEPSERTGVPIDSSKLLSAQRSVDDFTGIIRTAINDLYPHTLENLGLCRALEAYLTGVQNSAITLDLDFDKGVDKLLDSTQKLHTYRIITELVNNSLKHSNCTKITLVIMQLSNSIFIRVSDNGKGFDSRSRRNPDNYGIDNIESRVMLLDAQHRWMEDEMLGTCFELTIPINSHVTS